MYDKINNMYANIGKKIKVLAFWCFIGEAISSIMGGFIYLATQSDDDLVLLAVLVILLGPIIAFISSWLIYGFGEIIDKLTDIERNTRSDIKKSATQSNIDYERIAKIEKLRAQGLITEEEYQTAVAKSQTGE